MHMTHAFFFIIKQNSVLKKGREDVARVSLKGKKTAALKNNRFIVLFVVSACVFIIMVSNQLNKVISGYCLMGKDERIYKVGPEVHDVIEATDQ